MTQFTVGQKVAINRTHVVIVEKVTPTGRATAGGMTFGADGIERSDAPLYARNRIEEITPEIKNVLERRRRARAVAPELFDILNRVTAWVHNTVSAKSYAPAMDAVEKAERLNAAIREIMGDK